MLRSAPRQIQVQLWYTVGRKIVRTEPIRIQSFVCDYRAVNLLDGVRLYCTVKLFIHKTFSRSVCFVYKRLLSFLTRSKNECGGKDMSYGH